MFRKNGNLKIEGRFIPDNISSFFASLRTWIEELKCNRVVFDICIDYMTSNASRELFQLIRALEENQAIQDIILIWHYDEDDEEYYETGRFLSSRFENIKFLLRSNVR